MLEICLIDLQMNKYNPSLQACSSIYITKKILKIDQPWSAFLTRQTGHTEAEVHKCARDICILLNIVHTKKHFKGVFKKYSSPKFEEVAKFCQSLTASEASNDDINEAPQPQMHV